MVIYINLVWGRSCVWVMVVIPCKPAIFSLCLYSLKSPITHTEAEIDRLSGNKQEWLTTAKINYCFNPLFVFLLLFSLGWKCFLLVCWHAGNRLQSCLSWWRWTQRMWNATCLHSQRWHTITCMIQSHLQRHTHRSSHQHTDRSHDPNWDRLLWQLDTDTAKTYLTFTRASKHASEGFYEVWRLLLADSSEDMCGGISMKCESDPQVGNWI